MKKLKFLGTAILAASLIFAGCSSQADDETVDPVPVEKPADNNIKNPLTFNNSLLIVLVLGTVGATSIVVFGKRKKQKSL